MSILSDFNEYAGLLLDGRFDGILGNTIGQSTFGTAYSVNVGNSNEFNIDWQNEWLKNESVLFPGFFADFYNTVIPIVQQIMGLLPSPKNVGLIGAMPTGFFGLTVGNSFELTAGGELKDLSRGVEKTEFALDDQALYSALTGNAITFTETEKRALSLVPSVSYEILLNLFVTTYSQIASFYTGLISDDDSTGAEITQAAFTGMNLLLYLIVPAINTNLALKIYTIEDAYSKKFKELTEEYKNECKAKEDQAQLAANTSDIKTLQAGATKQAETTTNIIGTMDLNAKIAATDFDWKTASDRYKIAYSRWHADWDKWNFEKGEVARKQQKYDQGSWIYKTKKGARPPDFTKPEPVAPIWRDFFTSTIAPKYNQPYS
jgi:hypothetical protein